MVCWRTESLCVHPFGSALGGSPARNVDCKLSAHDILPGERIILLATLRFVLLAWRNALLAGSSTLNAKPAAHQRNDTVGAFAVQNPAAQAPGYPVGDSSIH